LELRYFDNGADTWPKFANRSLQNSGALALNAHLLWIWEMVWDLKVQFWGAVPV
jgi:hypothetical protein